MPRVPSNNHQLIPLQGQSDGKRVGRRRKVVKPSMPQFEVNQFEQEMLEYIVFIYNEEYDLSESDQILLQLYAVEYVKYLRLVNWELTHDQQVTMQKQHPGTRCDALMDRLGITRRHRMSKDRKEGDPQADARELLMSLGTD